MSPATRSVARAAALLAFPEAEIIEANTWEEAGQSGAASYPELLVLAEPDAASVAAATQAVDSAGLPRWATVVLGRQSAELADTVPPEEWIAPLVARVFRSALLQWELMRENHCLQGDLRTIARRIGHDLHTPIGCISACAHVLNAVVTPNDDSSNAVMFQNIEESLVDIVRIIDRVNFLLRASADPCPSAPCEMAGIVADVLSQMESRLRKTGAAVAQPDSWPAVNGVARWLQVIWENLLTNAIKYGGPAAQIRLDWTASEGGIRFSVSDRGPGVPPAIRPALFRPFDQLHRFHTPGLGLSIVQRLVSLQGGQCGYERIGGGSTLFYFTLPTGSLGPPLRRRAALNDALHSAAPTPASDRARGATGPEAAPDLIWPPPSRKPEPAGERPIIKISPPPISVLRN